LFAVSDPNNVALPLDIIFPFATVIEPENIDGPIFVNVDEPDTVNEPVIT